MSYLRAANRCPEVQCLMHEDCQYGKCFQNDIEFNSRCLRKDEELKCVAALMVAVYDPREPKGYRLTPSDKRCDGMNCTTHSQCKGWCELVYRVGAEKYFKC